MQKFPSIKILSLCLVLLMSLTLFTSCEDEIEGCTDATANNYDLDATLDDGSCMYDLEGCTDSNATNYNTEANIDDGSCEYPATPFLGAYDVVETCEFSQDTYTMTIEEDAFDQIGTISLVNFYNACTVTALVDGSNITIEEQTCATNTTVVGTGTLEGNVLTINMSVDGTIPFDCTLVATQQ